MTAPPISLIGSGSSSARRRSRAPMRMWWLHFGQTLRLRSSSARYSTASQAGHLIHRPSGTERERRSVLMRDGFFHADMSSAELQTLRLRSTSARYSTASQAGHLIHRPSGTERERRSVLMRDGFFHADM